MIEPVTGTPCLPELELATIEFWRREKTYEQSLARREGSPAFVFYEGPPTANGLPHPGHCLTRAIKDLFPRYKTMRGFRCERKAGWDTHGLPVEVEVCKELGIHSKEEIEAFGVEPFIHRCQESVWRYMRQWERLTERIGFWIHLSDAYVTYHQDYVESVWWALKSLFQRGLLYQGHKIVWWWAQGGTALSAGEVGQGYRQVADPSVYVRFPLVDEPGLSLLVWTTTPWTLPSNQFAAVNPDLEYAVVSEGAPHGRLIVAAAQVESLAAKAGRTFAVERSLRGSELVGRRYVPPFDYYYAHQADRSGRLLAGGKQHCAFRVVAAQFVTTDSGTGVVHQAPAFGEVDFEVLEFERARFVAGEGPELICAVAPDGKFTSEAPDLAGRWVKDTDRDITRGLKARGLLYHQEQYVHDYPFCWRAEEDPLIQSPRKSWFIRTSNHKQAMLDNNATINWLPEHIRDGRFGNFLETNVDWALSRERFWGTPLPIWVCEETGYQEAIESYAELLSKPGVQGTEVWDEAKRKKPDLCEHLKVHKPYIDAVTYDSPREPGGRMRRVSEVIDCWFDSGAMPFAQWGYPQTGRSKFSAQFPADFISEALDQTRGWFYSQLAISTLLFGEPAAAGGAPNDYPHPFRNCIVLGLMLGEDGQKMSKSKRNYREPAEIFDRYGADALRWYFFANQPPWTSIRYSEQAIKDSIPEFLLRLWNCYAFLVIYATIDGFDPQKSLQREVEQLAPDELRQARDYRPYAARGELDRWVISELYGCVSTVVARMDEYDNYAACQRITAFVDALSNWYVRRSRERFWAAGWSTEKADAYWTLYECLLVLAKVVAPFVPFLAEALWRNLAVAGSGGKARASVHLCDYPDQPAGAVDETLSQRMNLLREVVSLGHSARMSARLKVRQPLAKVEVILADTTHAAWLADHAALVASELNVKQVEFASQADQYVSYTVLPDLKRLGPRLGKRLPALKSALAKCDAALLLAELEAKGKVRVPLDEGSVDLDRVDLQVRLQAKEGWAAAHGPAGVVVLSTELAQDLLAEGLAREFVHAIQALRKELNCAYTDRIELGVETESAELQEAVDKFKSYIADETLAKRLVAGPLPDASPIAVQVAGHAVTMSVRVIGSTPDS